MATQITCKDTGAVEMVNDTQLAELQQRGVIHEEEWGYVADVARELEETLNDFDLMVCDFCGSPDVTWMFPAQDFVMSTSKKEDNVSVGEWAACEICAHLIEQGLTHDLVVRSTNKYLTTQVARPTPSVSVYAHEVVHAMIVQFENARTGPGVRVKKGEL